MPPQSSGLFSERRELMGMGELGKKKIGTGKSYSARLIANEAAIPVLYVPAESLMPKFNDKSEQLLMELFSVAKEFPNGAIIFLDEIRDIERVKKVMVIADTNREHDLNPILSRKFDTSISFHLQAELPGNSSSICSALVSK